MVFKWLDPPPSDGQELYVWARIEKRGGSGATSKQIAESLVLPYDKSMKLQMGVPNGDDMVVVVEIKTEPSKTAHALYFGESEPFSLRPGDDKDIKVAMALTRTPMVTTALSIVEATGPDTDLVNSPVVTLSFGCSGAVAVVAANDPTFSAGKETRQISDLGNDSGLYLWTGWDLDAGLGDRGDRPKDTSRTVYLKCRNANGYKSQVASATVVLDTDPPGLAAVPEFRRCDGAELADIAPNELWVTAGADCSFLARNDGCTNTWTDGPVQVVFSLSEPIVVESSEVYVDGGGVLSLDLCDSSETHIVCYYHPTGQEPQSPAGESLPFNVHAQVWDLAGNSAVLDLGRLLFDYVPPAPPDTLTSERIVYERVPWGSESTGDEPSAVVWGTEDAVEGVGTVRVYGGIPVAELNSGQSEPAGGFDEIVLPSEMPPSIQVAFEDRAGNLSEKVPVRDLVWVVTLGGKQSGSDVVNPSRFVAFEWFPFSLSVSGGTEVDTGPDAKGGEREETTGGGTWTRLVLEGPGARSNVVLEYDAGRGVTIVSGGHSSSALMNTWEWDGTNWQESPAVGGPGPRLDHSGAYDCLGGRVLLFGGRDGTIGAESYNDLWAYNGSVWSLLGPQAWENPWPGRRIGAAMVFDSRRRVAVLFGGDDPDSGDQDDLWEWDGGGWERRCDGAPDWDTCPELPDARFDHEMIFDTGRGKVVLFGGAYHDGYSVVELDDLWEWDGASWEKRCDGIPEDDVCPNRPSPRRDFGMAYDPIRKRIVVYGGHDVDGYAEDTWEWDGEKWERRCDGEPAGDACTVTPQRRASHSLTYDAGRGKVLLFGGLASDLENDFNGRGSDVWEWDGDRWLRIGATGDAWNAGPEFLHQDPRMVYDSARRTAVLFGGMLWGDQNDTWEFDGTTWDERCDGAPSSDTCDPEPDGRECHGIAYDRWRGRTVIHGGSDIPQTMDDTWEWDGQAWEMVCGEPVEEWCPVWPAKREKHSMVYDEESGTTLLFGGTGSGGARNDTWEWDGQQWSERCDGSPEVDVCTSEPPGLYWAGMTYDTARHVAVLFGGWNDEQESLSDELWEWDGTQWSRRCDGSPESDVCPISPSPRDRSAMAYDRAQGVTLVHGGCTEEGKSGDLWSWDGDVWTELEPADPESDGNPVEREGGGMVYLEEHDRTLLLGGNTLDSSGKTSWLWNSGRSARPGHMFVVPFEEAETGMTESLQEITVEWISGADGGPSNDAFVGASLRLWDLGHWREVTANIAPADAAGDLRWSSADPWLLRRVLVGETRGLHLAAVPVFPNAGGVPEGGASYRTIATDYVEATLQYFMGAQWGWELDELPGCDDLSDPAGCWIVEGANLCPPENTDVLCLQLSGSAASLVSPRFDEPAGDYQWIQVRGAADIDSLAVRIRWLLSGDADFSLERSVEFEMVSPDGVGALRTYRVPLSPPEWSDQVSRIRLEFPDTTGAQTVHLDWLRLTGVPGGGPD